jgi:predicted phage-related endonuclease
MANNELIKKVEEIKELEELLEEVKANIEDLKDVLKAEMLKQGTEEMDLDGRYIVRWTSQLASRFDTKRFKEEYKDLYLSFTKEVSSKRFSIA